MSQKYVMRTVSFVVVSFVLGLLGGYYLTPEYKQGMFVKEQMDLGEVNQYVDLRYINKMIAHHRGAILLADQVIDKSSRSEIKSLAGDIQANEPKLIAELYQWKLDWYNDKRQVEDPVVPNLGDADDNLDLRFLNALIAHHSAGVVMTDEISVKSSRSEILDNANAVGAFLTESAVNLKSWREQWYGVK